MGSLNGPAVIEPFQKHLETKWRNFFRFFDFDNDGVWTEGDLRYFADRLIREAGNMLSESGATYVRKQSNHWLTIQEKDLFHVKSGGITEDVICETLREHLQQKFTDKHLFKELDIFCEIFFEIMDINRDGKISKPELNIFYGTVGIHNQDVTRPLFNCLDLISDRTVTREEFRIAYREYFFGDQRCRNQRLSLLFDKSGLLCVQNALNTDGL